MSSEEASPVSPGVSDALADRLIIGSAGAGSKRILLKEPRYRLGRSSSNELAFPEDPRLSREHLLFERNANGWSVKDLGSQNGTQVNGVATNGNRLLAGGDRISAGNLTIQYESVARGRVTFVSQPVEDAKPTISVDLEAALQASSEPARSMRESSYLKALLRAGRELAGQGALEKLFEVLLDLSMETVGASRGAVMTKSASGELQIRASRGEGFSISTGVRDQVMEQARSLLVRDALWDRDLASRPSIVMQEIRSILAVPLQTDERVTGLVYLDSPHVVREFTADDLNLITVIANIAAIRIENARLMEKEQARRLFDQDLLRATEIQRGLLPAAVPSIPGFDCAGYNAPCRMVGGDYYDFLPYPDGRWAFVIGDVSGKGLGAALLMSSLQARTQVIFGNSENLAEEVARLNRSMAASCPGNSFVTFFIAVIDPGSGDVVYCNAGHNAPLLHRAGGETEMLEASGMPLGILAAASYQHKTCRMNPGDTLVMFSDGVTEAYGADPDQEFGEERLLGIVRRTQHQAAAAILSEVKKDLDGFTGGIAADDVTLVVAVRQGQPPASA